MSFKDLRDLSESLKILGYPKTLPLQALSSNYGSLNSFKVVADILQWLAERLEPGTTLPGGTETEPDRVLLIRSATEFFVTKSSVKLNPRKLYASSSATAKELLKITTILTIKPEENDEREEESYKSIAQFDLGDKMDDLRRARELSSELTKRGAVLYDLLSREMVNRETRINQSTRPMESSYVERTLKNAIASAQIKLQSAKNQLESSRQERNSLNNKLQRKKAELERSKQRLEALQKIRPAYLEEFEQLEDELRDLFQQYFLRIQCRDSLRAQMNARMKNSTPIGTPIAKPTSETSMTFLPDGLIDDDDDDGADVGINGDEDDDDDGDDILKKNVNDGTEHHNLRKTINDINGSDLHDNLTTKNDENRNKISSNRIRTHQQQQQQSRVRPTTGRLKPKNGTTVGRHKIIGSMLGDPDDETLDSTLGSGESDSDIDLDGVEYGLGSDDDISLSKLTGDVPTKIASKHDNHSDEDF